MALKTVALCCMLAQWGLHVPCQEAWVCMNSQYLCDIGDGQSLSENLSTFSAHITNVLDILSRVNPESLVIMDELGSGTDPTEGMGIAIAILEALRESGCLFLVTTHYPEVKEYAARTQGVTNARMTFDQDSLQPLYRMVIGEAGLPAPLPLRKGWACPGPCWTWRGRPPMGTPRRPKARSYRLPAGPAYRETVLLPGRKTCPESFVWGTV